jgi:hypothetical protein
MALSVDQDFIVCLSLFPLSNTVPGAEAASEWITFRSTRILPFSSAQHRLTAVFDPRARVNQQATKVLIEKAMCPIECLNGVWLPKLDEASTNDSAGSRLTSELSHCLPAARSDYWVEVVFVLATVLFHIQPSRNTPQP